MKFKRLIIKRSSLPGSGMGLFAGREIPKGGVVTEYAGRRRKWRLIKDVDGCGDYILGLNRTIVIDAQPWGSGQGRYANDAAGLRRVAGFRNNSEYVIRGGKVFIETTRRIKKGEEILVGYGKAYWKQAEKNIINRRKWRSLSPLSK